MRYGGNYHNILTDRLVGSLTVFISPLFLKKQIGHSQPQSFLHLLQWEGGRERHWIPSRSNATRTGLNSITQKEGSCKFSGRGFLDLALTYRLRE